MSKSKLKFKAMKWKSLYKALFEQYKEQEERTVQAEIAKQKMEENYAYLQTTIGTLLRRPLIATLTDEQVQHLVHNLGMYLESIRQDPTKMN